MGKFLGTFRVSKMTLYSLTFMVDPTINLMNKLHHDCGRGSVILCISRVPKNFSMK